MRTLAKLVSGICALLMLSGVGVRAQEAKEDLKYPLEVVALLEYARAQCTVAGGTKTTFGENAVRKIDLTGDGRTDYVISMEGAKCEPYESYFCGTGGCGLEILVGQPNGTLVSVFDMRVRSYEILKGSNANRIRFELHGMYCGRSGNPSCYKTHRITAKPFEFKEPK